MKCSSSILLIFVLSSSISCGVFKKEQDKFYPDLSQVDKNPDIISTCVEIKPGLFMHQNETSNFQWRAYTEWNKQRFGAQSAEYKDALPDTTVWDKPLQYGAAIQYNYFSHAAFNTFPLVGISHSQATKFCEWMTDSLNKYYSSVNYFGEGNENGSRLICRLPTEEEWLMVAPEEFQYNPANDYDSLNDWRSVHYHGTVYSEPVIAHRTNSAGVFHIDNNVAEMIATEGIVMGADNYNLAGNSKLPRSHNLKRKESTARKWIGFRYIIDRN